MKKEKKLYPVITIGRQFGSGGRRIGKLVADKMGYAYYDTELLSEAAERLGFAREIFDAHDEVRPSPLRSLLQGMFGLADNFHDVSICGERMYIEQTKVIKDICAKGPCVIVGRTADYIMKGHPYLLSVFLHAPEAERVGRIISQGEAESPDEALDRLKRYDRNREDYYNFYTGTQNWGRAANYMLSIDSSLFEDSMVADIIITASQALISEVKGYGKQK